MTAIERRALYNLLRLHWLNDPTLQVEPWQVEDYRALPLEQLFTKLGQLDIRLDETSFVAYADECDSPEDLTEHLLGDRPVKPQEEDQVYLLIFELWYRLMSEKPSLSIFCNELDHAIYLFDSNELENPLILQDVITSFLSILNENVDVGIEPKEAFKRVSDYCANDIETFFYDFISQQIDEEHESYAQELLDGLAIYVKGNKWFDLLQARFVNQSHAKSANRLLLQLAEDQLESKDLEFNLELLAFMSEAGSPHLFRKLVVQIVSLLQFEEDFQDLVAICIDYYHRLDQEQVEHVLQKILRKRSHKSLQESFSAKDPDFHIFLTLIQS